jgi:hypothetical protein
MKQYILILITVISIISCKAQTREPQRIVNLEVLFQENFNDQNGDYYIDNENKLNVFEGIWVYNDGNGTILTINLRKKNQVLNETLNNQYSFSDMLILTYKLEKNNIVLHDNLFDSLPTEILGIYDGYFGYLGFSKPNYFEANGGFHDANYNIISSCTITKVNTIVGQPEKIKIHLYGASRKNEPSFYNGLTEVFSIPNNIELVKQ